MTIKDEDGTIESEGNPARFVADDTGSGGAHREFASDSGQAVIRDSGQNTIHVAEQAYTTVELQQQVYTGLDLDGSGEKQVGQLPAEARSDVVDNAQAAYLVGYVNVTSQSGSFGIELELYDESTGSANVATETLNASSTGIFKVGSTTDHLSALSTGNLYTVRWNVQSGTGGSGDAFDATGARIIYV